MSEQKKLQYNYGCGIANCFGILVCTFILTRDQPSS